MKKLISVLLCIAMMFTFLTVISFAADGDAAATGAETIFNMLMKLLSGVDWTSILSVFTATIQTLMRLFGGGA